MQYLKKTVFAGILQTKENYLPELKSVLYNIYTVFYCADNSSTYLLSIRSFL